MNLFSSIEQHKLCAFILIICENEENVKLITFCKTMRSGAVKESAFESVRFNFNQQGDLCILLFKAALAGEFVSVVKENSSSRQSKKV